MGNVKETFMGYELGPVEEVDIKSIKRNEENTKYFAPPTSQEVDKLQESIHQVGLNEPIRITKDNLLIDGHRRHLVMSSMGKKTIKVKRFIKELKKDEIRTLLIAANLVPQDTMRSLSPTKRRDLYRELYPNFDDRIMIHNNNNKSKVALTPEKVADDLGIPLATARSDLTVLRRAAKTKVSKAKRSIDENRIMIMRNNFTRLINYTRASNTKTQVEIKKDFEKFVTSMRKMLKS